SGPYVSPNDVLTLKYRPRPNVTTTHPRTDSVAPYASHDRAGWWRRGDHRNNSVIATAINTTASGQRVQLQSVVRKPLSISSPTWRPHAINTRAPAANAPAVAARNSA